MKKGAPITQEYPMHTLRLVVEHLREDGYIP